MLIKGGRDIEPLSSARWLCATWRSPVAASPRSGRVAGARAYTSAHDSEDRADVGRGRHQLEVNRWCLEMGGHCRTGLEDNVRWDKHRLAESNAELVNRVADLCSEYGRTVATPQVARTILGLN